MVIYIRFSFFFYLFKSKERKKYHQTSIMNYFEYLTNWTETTTSIHFWSLKKILKTKEINFYILKLLHGFKRKKFPVDSIKKVKQ